MTRDDADAERLIAMTREPAAASAEDVNAAPRGQVRTFCDSHTGLPALRVIFKFRLPTDTRTISDCRSWETRGVKRVANDRNKQRTLDLLRRQVDTAKHLRPSAFAWRATIRDGANAGQRDDQELRTYLAMKMSIPA